MYEKKRENEGKIGERERGQGKLWIRHKESKEWNEMAFLSLE